VGRPGLFAYVLDPDGNWIELIEGNGWSAVTPDFMAGQAALQW
jgi:hypothetical protein